MAALCARVGRLGNPYRALGRGVQAVVFTPWWALEALKVVPKETGVSAWPKELQTSYSGTLSSVCMNATVCVEASRSQFSPIIWVLGLNSGHQDWQQVLLWKTPAPKDRPKARLGMVVQQQVDVSSRSAGLHRVPRKTGLHSEPLLSPQK